MADYILLMHDAGAAAPEDWNTYLSWLGECGVLRGGSAIGRGICLRKAGAAPDITRHLTGYIKIAADTLEHAAIFLAGNPIYEHGGVVEIRELPVTD